MSTEEQRDAALNGDPRAILDITLEAVDELRVIMHEIIDGACDEFLEGLHYLTSKLSASDSE